MVDTNSILEIVGWIAYICVMIGSLTLTIKQKSPFIVWMSWITGNILYLVRAIFLNDYPIFAVQISFVILNAFGFIVWYLKRKRNEQKTFEEEFMIEELRKKGYIIYNDYDEEERESIKGSCRVRAGSREISHYVGKSSQAAKVESGQGLPESQ